MNDSAKAILWSSAPRAIPIPETLPRRHRSAVVVRKINHVKLISAIIAKILAVEDVLEI